MGVDFAPDASLLGMQWALDEPTSWVGQSLASAITQKFRLDSPSSGSLDPTLAAWIYCSDAPGSGRYGIEITTDPDRTADATPLVVFLDTLTVSASWTPNTGTILEAIDDPEATPDDDVSYVSTPTGGSAIYLTGQSASATLDVLDGKRILAVEIEMRARSNKLGARIQAALTLNDVNFRGPAHTVNIEDFTTYTTRFVYNPQGLSSWPDNDVRNFRNGGTHSWGVYADPNIEVTQLLMRVFYGDDARLGAYQTSYVFSPGWNEIAYPALLDDGQDYYLTISPLVVDGANYAVLPLLQPAPDDTHEATSLVIAADNTIDASDGTALGGCLGFIVQKRDTAEGQVYHSAAVAGGDPATNVIDANTSQTQELVGESLTVDTVLARVLAPRGEPSAPLTIRLESGPASAPVPEAEATIAPARVTSGVSSVSAALDTPVTLVASDPYRLVAESTAGQARPYRLARARTDEITIPETLIGSASYDISADFDTNGAATVIDCIDDALGAPDDDTTYAQAVVAGAYLQVGPDGGELSAVTGRTIASLDFVFRAGSGQRANVVRGYLDLPGGTFYSDGVTDAVPQVVKLATAWNTYRFRFPTNPDTGVAWTDSEIEDFDGSGSSSIGIEVVAPGVLVTQAYLQVNFADNDLAEALTYGGLDAYADGDDWADFALAVGDRPDAPTGLVGSWDSDAYAVNLSWTSIGSLSYVLRRDCNGTWRDVDGTISGGTFTDYTAPLDTDVDYGLFAVSPSGLESEPAEVTVTTTARLDAIGSNDEGVALKCVVVSWPFSLTSGRIETVTPGLSVSQHFATLDGVIQPDAGEIVVEFWQDATGTTDENAQFWTFDELRRTQTRLWLRLRNNRYCAPVVITGVAREFDTQHRIRARMTISGLERWSC